MNESKKLIIEKTLPLFIAKGFNGVSLTDILKNINLSRGAFYYHFVSKEQCFEECAKHFINSAKANFIVSKGTSLREYIDISIEILSSRINSYTALDRLSFMNEVMKIVPNFSDYFSKMHDEEINAWSKVIEHAITSNEIKDIMPANEIAKLFIYQCDGLVVYFISQQSKVSLDEEIKKTWENIYNLLKK